VTISTATDLVIEVTDNGTGIPGTGSHSGLHSLTTRARVFGRQPHR
jgi:signal transduction histidine kinase